ncbi:TPA: hypothetical protein ACS714_003740 [Providencia alcalifaciens]
MSNEIGFLESNSTLLNEISRVLNRDGAIDMLFSSIKIEDLNKDEKYFLFSFLDEIKETFSLARDNFSKIDEYCQITAEADLLIENGTGRDILLSYTIILRFFTEYLVVQANGFYQNLFIKRIDFIKKNEKYFYILDEVVSSQLRYIIYEYRSYIFSCSISSLKKEINEIKNIRDYIYDVKVSISDTHEKCKIVENKLMTYQSEIDDFYKEKSEKIHNDLEIKENRILELKGYLENLGGDYNFAGLTKAYSDFYRTKSIERWISLSVLVLLALLSFLPLGIKLITENANKVSDVNVLHYFGFSALTVIALYFFRVSLQNYNSIKAELTQIKLRMNLCMFVDHYSDFSKNKDNREALEKFENIIFSNIQPNENNIPSTFDGLEQLASLIESVTKRSK